ncbi:MAG: DUF4350 domain-containing protein [Azoarcus sp.]|jgi:hypothetical protein|nr:DUF4350 domain-containing protein [Azoarcus sp.]
MRISIWKMAGLVLLLALLAFGLWVYSQIEFVEETIATDRFKGAAARNPLLAAGRLAERYGAAAHYVPAYTKPPSSGGTLVFTAPRHWLTATQNEALLDWVEKGGHLIVSPQSQQHRGKRAERRKKENASPDVLLASLGVSINEEDSDEVETNTNALFNWLGRLINATPSAAQVIKLPDGTQIKARFNPKLRLKDLDGSSDWQILDSGADAPRRKDESNYGLSFMWGKGRATVLANLDFLDNAQIGENDHAALFAWAASLKKGQSVWFVYGSDVPPLWLWLLNYAGTVLIAAALLLVIWLWMISRRFGSLLPARSAERRSIVEHVAASARYLWRCKQGQVLYRTLCEDFYKQAFLRHPQWSRLTFQELTQQIALFAQASGVPQLSALTAQAVGDLLDTSRPRDEKQFAAHSHLLDILRNKL